MTVRPGSDLIRRVVASRDRDTMQVACACAQVGLSEPVRH